MRPSARSASWIASRRNSLRQMQLEAHLDERAADLRGDRLGQLRLAVVDDPQRALEDEPPGVRIGGAPLPLRALGGAVGLVDLLDRGDGMEASFSPL